MVAAAALLSVVIGFGVPVRGADAAPARVNAAAATFTGTGIPEGFLLYESKKARNSFEKKIGPMRWKTSDRQDAPLLIDPCVREKSTDKSRQASRTITGRSVTWDGDYAEQLIVYRDETTARAAVEGLRADLRRCGKRNRFHFTYRTKRAHIGDEAFLVDVFELATARGATVMRKGRTVAVYSLPLPSLQRWRKSEYGQPQAREMARKLAATPL